MLPLTPHILIQAYQRGLFPMAHSRHGPIYWCSPDPRAIIPLDKFHVPRSLQRQVKQNRLTITCNRAFEAVITACAEPRSYTHETWISQEIAHTYIQLHNAHLAQSIEAWLPCPDQEENPQPQLVGGLFGVAIGGAFFGESMFSRISGASKICLVHLVEHLRKCGYTLFDVQYASPHLEQFGVIEIPRRRYLDMLQQAVSSHVAWGNLQI